MSFSARQKFPRAILHIDGDAFFASCEQARDPALFGKPVVTGQERGIAASMSYEAKALGITRAMKLYDIKKNFPNVIIMPSDYETYGLLSKRFYAIVRRYTPDIEEYGIDECFADITGLRRLHHTSYEKIAARIAEDLSRELGFTFSIGLGPNKSIAKIGSKFNKPSGITVIPTREIPKYIGQIEAQDIWGVGPQTNAFLEKHSVYTALDFAQKNEDWVMTWLTKPHQVIWKELNGQCIMELSVKEKTSYASIQKVRTFTPPSCDRDFVFAQLVKNIENACMKARRYNLEPKEIAIFLKTQTFHTQGKRITLSRPTAFPHDIISVAQDAFDKFFNARTDYRQTGVTLLKLEPVAEKQLDLFGGHIHAEKMHDLYSAVDKLRGKYGKHTLHVAESHVAHTRAQHENDRGVQARRKASLMSGENKRRHLGIPLFMGDVV